MLSMLTSMILALVARATISLFKEKLLTGIAYSIKLRKMQGL